MSGNIEQIKSFLIEKLKEIKKRKLIEDEYIFLDSFEKARAVNTKSDEKMGILPGQFFSIPCNGNELNLYVGKGKNPDKNKDRQVLWFLNERSKGVSYYEVETFEKLQKEIDAFIVP